MSDGADLVTSGRYTELPVREMPEDMRQAYDCTLTMRGQVPGPHKIYLSDPKLLRTIAPTGAYFQTESTLTTAETEIVTNVIDSRWAAAYANYEHEKASIELGHLESEKVAALIAGMPTSFDDARQQAVYELSSALAAERAVPVRLFRRARDLLGDTGIVDVTVTAACLTLMAYDAPSSATGLDPDE
jgi:4-carboxymuconolactone decarboxylase